jgi:hypothetical protein
LTVSSVAADAAETPLASKPNAKTTILLMRTLPFID